MDITKLTELIDLMRAKGVLGMKLPNGVELHLGAAPAAEMPEADEPEADTSGLPAKYRRIRGLVDGV